MQHVQVGYVELSGLGVAVGRQKSQGILLGFCLCLEVISIRRE